MESITKISNIDYDKITSNKNSILEKSVEADTFISNLEHHCLKFDITYFIKNFLILTVREDVHDEAGRVDDGKPINQIED